MFNGVFNYRLRPIQKICLSGLFIALTVILQKVIAINYIPIMPFVRVSLGGPALIIFSSIFFGPIYGLVVGVASDILGYLIFDPKTFGFYPQITAIYGLLGFVSFFVFWLIKKLKNEKLCCLIELLSLALMAVGVSLFFILNDEVTLYSTTYSIQLWQKISITIALAVLTGILVLSLFLMRRKITPDNANINIWQISFASFLLEIVVMVLFGSFMKSLAFNFNFFIIAVCQLVVLFINIPMNTLLISTFMRLTNRFKNDNEMRQ